MKVGVITFHSAHNYGAALQAYALRTAIEKLGVYCEMIDYRPEIISRHYRLPDFRWSCNLRDNFRKLRYCLFSKKRCDLKYKKYEKFITKYLNLGPKRYKNCKDLLNNIPDYDIFVCGSDQIWNPNMTGLDPVYFLSFVPKFKRKVAYSASFGTSYIPKEYHKTFKKLLGNIEYLSVREEQGKRIVNSLVERGVEVVLDPTLLLDEEEWEKISRPYSNLEGKKYILCYYIENNKSLENISKKCSKIMGIPRVLINASNKDRFRGVIPVFDASPAEFIKLFQGASFVVTNSFHGVAFAINFRKPFFLDLLKGRFAFTNSRLTNIIENLNLSTRLVSNLTTIDRELLDMDFEEITRKLKILKEKSLNFLNKSICG
ncbi:MAG: polysaccharide pyruvyl transferase family protein [Candidatus Omnitrophica bacterium]|nr:polysaccharide pyruvyl transferase family protein [Candidatus Omnitrophota bacterium]MDD5429602.1 polysaccharide pyruvyl transferase family protein [Candidatus Omnitrophota bacterium]